MEKRILILGNGFNKALGLSVGYDDFFQSEEWVKISECTTPIIKYIKEHKCNNVNIEDLLKDYIHSGECGKFNNAGCDKLAFLELEKAFAAFVNKTIQKKIERINNDGKERDHFMNSIAFCTIKEFQEEKNRLSNINHSFAIYSFNYTDFDSIGKNNTPSVVQDCMNICNGKGIGNQWGAFLNIDYMHGKSSTTNSLVILGLSESSFKGCTTEICEQYDFLLKEKHPNYWNYKKDYLTKSLQTAEVIEFYGFGFTEPDYPYFETWLKSKPAFKKKRKIVLHILKGTEDEIIQTMKNIAGCNWLIFISYHEISFHYDDGITKVYSSNN